MGSWLQDRPIELRSGSLRGSFLAAATSGGVLEAGTAAREPGRIEAAAAGRVGYDHGAHLAVVEAAVHLLLHAVRALVPERTERQEYEPAVAHHCNARLRPANKNMS